MWAAPNRKPIFAIIGHWITPDFEEREVLEFIEVRGSHTGEALALVVERLLVEFNLQGKLFTSTGDNAGNNGTFCNALFQSLLQGICRYGQSFEEAYVLSRQGQLDLLFCTCHCSYLQGCSR